MNKPSSQPYSPHSAARPQRNGFTLLEIMIAMTILAFIVTAIYSSWMAVVRGTKIGLEAAARMQRSRMAMRCLVDSLLSLQMFGANAPYYSFIADTGGDFAYLSFAGRLPPSFPDAGVFGDQVVRRVTFTVEPARDGRNQLVMYQMPLLIETNADQQPVSIVLAREVSQFSVDFWAPRGNKWVDRWLFTNQLPALVRITLALGQPNSFRTDPDSMVTRVVALPAMIIPPAYQQALRGPPLPPPGVPGQPGGPGTVPGTPPPITTGPPGMRTPLADLYSDPSALGPGVGRPFNSQPFGASGRFPQRP